MPWIENDPYSLKIVRHVLADIHISVGTNTHCLTIDSYDAAGHKVKTTEVDLDVFDAAGTILMPADWPADWPSGEQLYAFLEHAYYGRLREEKPWLIGAGAVAA